MFTITFQQNDQSSEQSLDFTKPGEITVGSAEEHTIHVDWGKEDSLLCTISLTDDSVEVSPAEGVEDLMVNGSALTSPLEVSYPLDLRYQDIQIKVTTSPSNSLSEAELSSLMQELEASTSVGMQDATPSESSSPTEEASDSSKEVESSLEEDLAAVEEALQASSASTESGDEAKAIDLSTLMEEASQFHMDEPPAQEESSPAFTPPTEVEFAEEEEDSQPQLAEEPKPTSQDLEYPSVTTAVPPTSKPQDTQTQPAPQEPIAPKPRFKANTIYTGLKKKSPTWLLIFLLLLLGVLGTLFVNQQEKLKQQQAARRMCDIAMTLWASQNIYQEDIPSLLPLDSGMTESRIASILPNSFSPPKLGSPLLTPYGYHIDIQLLEDASFLLIASPNSSLLNSLFGKKTMVIHSESMLIKQVSDKANEFLQLDPTSLKDKIHNLPNFDVVNSPRAAKLGFFTPLAWQQEFQRTESPIYTFPRYFSIAQEGIQLLSQLALKDSSPSSVLTATSFFNRFAKATAYPFYSTVSKRKLEDIRKNLSDFGPFFQSLPLAHIKLNSEEDGISKVEFIEPSLKLAKIYQSLHSTSNQVQKNTPSLATEGKTKLKLQLDTLLQAANKPLLQAKSQLSTFLNQKQNPLSEDFLPIYHQLSADFLSSHQKAVETLQLRLSSLYQNWNDTEANQKIFFDLISQEGLSPYLSSPLHSEELEEASFSSTSEKSLSFATQITQFLNATTYQETLSIAKVLHSLSAEQAAPTPEQALSRQSKFQKAMLKKFEHIILSTSSRSAEKQGETKLFLQNAGTLFSLARLSSLQQQNFFDYLFDELGAEIRKLPYNSYLILKELHDMKLKDDRIDSEIDDISQVNDNLQNIPLAVTKQIDSEEEILDIARIGRQLLAHARSLPPSKERSEELEDAIGLLREGLPTSSALWAPILQANLYLVELPQEKIQELLAKVPGLANLQDNPIFDIDEALKRYQAQKLDIAEDLKRGNSYEQEQVASLQGLLTPLLEQAQQKVRTIHEQVAALLNSYDGYLEKLFSFLKDYEEAYASGFFANQRSYQSSQLHNLKKKYREAKELHPILKEKLHQLSSLINSYADFIQKENQAMKSTNFFTHSQALPSSSPFMALQLASSIKENLAITVLPTP